MSTSNFAFASMPGNSGGDSGFFTNLGSALGGVADIIRATQNQPPVWGTAGSNPAANNPQPTQQTGANTTGTTNVTPMGLPVGALIVGGAILVAVLIWKS